MASVIHEIVATYRSIGAKTLVMPARYGLVYHLSVRHSCPLLCSIVTGEEVVALVSLQPDHLTLSGTVLDLLAALPHNTLPDPLPLPAGLFLSPRDVDT